jgi:hypothetical protein
MYWAAPGEVAGDCADGLENGSGHTGALTFIGSSKNTAKSRKWLIWGGNDTPRASEKMDPGAFWEAVF